MDTIEKSGKTVEEAVEAALKALHASIDEVDYEVLEPGSKGIFGIGAKPARVAMTKKYDPVKKATTFIKEVCMAMGVLVDVDAEMSEKQLKIELSSENIGVLIGKRGQTLDALQYLVNLTINKGESTYINVLIDAEGYRAKRKETLEHLAIGVAKRVHQTKTSVHLEPMSPNERRIIHSVLQSDKFVYTYSEGEEPYRAVVVEYKRNGNQGNARNHNHSRRERRERSVTAE